MRKTLVTFLMVALAVAIIAIVVAWAQQPASKEQVDKGEKTEGTKVERFLSMKGILIVRDYHSVGKLKPSYGRLVEVKVVKLYTPGDERSESFGVRFEREASGEYGSDHIVWLDYDEAKEVVESLSYMGNMATKMAGESVEYTEIEFKTKGDFSAGFYQKETKQAAFIRLSSYGEGALVSINMSQIQELHDLVEAATKKLQSLGAE